MIRSNVRFVRRGETIAGLIAALLLLSAMALHAQGKPKPPLIQLDVDLVDGARLLGEPYDKTMPFRTRLATMQIPWEQVLDMEIDNSHERTTLKLIAGDRLSGMPGFDGLSIKCIFGKTTVDLSHIRRIRARLNPLSEGLVVHYSFDEKADKAEDKSGNGNRGWVHGVTWTSVGKSDGAYKFVGDGKTINVGNTPKTFTDWTVCAWIRPDASHTRTNHIVSCIGRITETSPLVLRCKDGRVGAYSSDLFSKKSISGSDKWHFVCTSGSAKGTSVYLDGVLEGRNEARNTIGGSMVLGADVKNRNINPYVGLLDEVMIFKRTLSDAEVHHLYVSGLTIKD